MSSAPASRASSPSPHSHPTEVTALIPPSSHSRTPHTPTTAGAVRRHDRKASVGGRSLSGRSIAGSVRGYGTVPVRPGPNEQPARVSKQGQRRILTTVPLQATFFILVFLTFISLVLTLFLLLNTAMDFTGILPPYRGSGFAEFWVSVVGSWVGLGGVLFFSHPSYLFFLTTLITLILHAPILLLTLISTSLKRLHHPLFLVPLTVSLLTHILTLLANFLVRRARRIESERVIRMLTEAAQRERAGEDENVARALVGMQGKGIWGRFVSFIGGILGLIAGLAGMILVVLLIIDLIISAYDRASPLPSASSQMVKISPPGPPWSINVHLACVDPPKVAEPEAAPRRTRRPKVPPTVLYEAPSGVPGSLALLDIPLLPASEDAVNSGRWLFDLQQEGKLGRVCVWDRPGYGFSEVMSNADVGGVADALWVALDAAGEAGNSTFALVGEGFGGLITRVFASRRPAVVHSLLHLDAQTAQTYFNDSPKGRSTLGLLVHRLVTRLFPSLLTPLSIRRLPSVLFRHSSSLSRVLASTYPAPSSAYLNENLLKARLQETFGAHSYSSASFRALLESGSRYPRDQKAIVISSKGKMEADENWAEGQRGLAEEVTSEEGLVEWIRVEGGHRVCEGEGRSECERAITTLLQG